MQDRLLKEYEVLSEDRRRGVDIFLKGFIIACGIIAFGFKLLMDTQDIYALLVVSISGLVFGSIGFPYWLKGKKHDYAIRKRLNEIATKLELAPIISTGYIFDVTVISAILIAGSWIAMTFVRVIKLI
jgi:hypothetical protein